MVPRRSAALAGLLFALIASLVLASATGAQEPPEGQAEVVLTIFHGEGCGHCARALDFLDGLQDRWPTLRIDAYEVWYDDANRDLFASVAAAHGSEPTGVPTIFLDGRMWVGFSDSTGREIEAVAAALLGDQAIPNVDVVSVELPVVGEVEVGDRSLVAATALIGFADGMNPCSLWALSILLALVLHSGSRRRVFVVGATFLAVTSTLYGVYILGAYSTLDYVSQLNWIRAVVAAVAGGFGLVQLGSYLRRRSSLLSIPAASKPRLYRRMRKLADPDRSLPAVLAGTTVLAIGVSLLETPCTAGLPLLWADLVAARDVSGAGAAVLFALYLGVFLVDEFVVFAAAVMTMRATRLQEEHGDLLHLVGGSVMVTLAGTMLVAPDQLESVAGTLSVFFTAAALAFVLRWWRTVADRSSRRTSHIAQR